MVGEQPGARGRVVGHVNISSTRVADGGNYHCLASNAAGKSSHSANLNVYGKPIYINAIFLTVYI